MSRFPALLLLSVACKAPEPARSEPVPATIDLSIPAPEVNPERPEPIDTAGEEDPS